MSRSKTRFHSRPVILVDAKVAIGCISKGRSSARALPIRPTGLQEATRGAHRGKFAFHCNGCLAFDALFCGTGFSASMPLYGWCAFDRFWAEPGTVQQNTRAVICAHSHSDSLVLLWGWLRQPTLKFCWLRPRVSLPVRGCGLLNKFTRAAKLPLLASSRLRNL